MGHRDEIRVREKVRVEDETGDVVVEGDGAMDLDFFVVGDRVRVIVFAGASADLQDGHEFIVCEAVEDMGVVLAAGHMGVVIG